MDMACVNEYDEEHIYEAPKEAEVYEVPKEVEAVPKKPNDYGHYYQPAAAAAD